MYYVVIFGVVNYELGFEDDIVGGLYVMMEGWVYNFLVIFCFLLEYFDCQWWLGKYNFSYFCVLVGDEFIIEGL